MLTITLLSTALLAGLGLCNVIDPSKSLSSPRHREETPKVAKFSIKDIAKYTGVDLFEILGDPDNKSDQTTKCISKNGPDRLGCPLAMYKWSEMKDNEGFLSIKKGSCVSVSLSCCQTLVCAPKADTKIHPEEVVGRMWKPLTTECVSGGHGGIWASQGWDVMMMMSRPEQCNPSDTE